MENLEDFNGTLHQYSFMFPFEKNYVPNSGRQWMERNWHLSFYFSAIYVVVIFGLKYLMTNSKPFTLKSLLLAWNISLAVISILIFCRTLPEFMHTLNNYGIYNSVCVSDYLTHDKVSSFWTFLFVLTKLPEFGDTVFIVLRKQPLIFLHWYHHIMTLIYAWYGFKEFTPSARWFTVMNSGIHSLMYSYYALKAMKVRIPRSISAVITFSQLTQMAVGCYVNYKAAQFLLSGTPCYITTTNIVFSALMYLSYFILFGNFFYQSYLNKARKAKAKAS